MRGRQPLILILVFAFIFGFLNILLNGRVSAQQPWKVLEQLAIVVLAYWWYHSDKTSIKYRTGPLLNMNVIALPIVAIPIYLFRSRGIRNGIYSFTLFVIFLGGMLGTTALGGFIGDKITH